MRNKILKKSKSILPGLFICLIIGIIAEFLGKSFPTIGAATFAIFIGIFLKVISMMKVLDFQKKIF